MRDYEQEDLLDISNRLNKFIVSYESERLFAQNRGDFNRAFLCEKKVKEIEEIRDKIIKEGILDYESKEKIRGLLEKEDFKKRLFGKMIKIVSITTILSLVVAYMVTNDVEDAVWFGIIYFIIAFLIGKIIVQNKSFNYIGKNENDVENPIQK